MALTENEVKDVIATALIRAWEDEQFKDELLAKPLETIKRLIWAGISIKQRVEVVDFEESNTFSSEMELPPYVIVGDEELKEEALDFVAGGSNVYDSITNFNQYIRYYL
jgi:hypothetical protein